MVSKPMSQHATDLLGLVFWILLTFGVAWFASHFEPGGWYLGLAKPGWTPPGWVFGPVWGILYLTMSISAWLVWRQRRSERTHLPLGFYLVQLLLNGLWSWLFFGRHLIGIALIDLCLLAVFLAVTVILFLRVQKLAGSLLIPYLLWVCFAAALNFRIWSIN